MDKVTFNVFRLDPEVDEEPRLDSYELEFKEGMTVLQGLFDILERHDGSLSFRYACRESICGACALFINGSYRLACRTQVKNLGSEVTILPMPHLEIIKDLVVDMTPFWDNYERIKPYLMPAEDADLDKERLQSQADRSSIDEMIDCILCGACHSSCPSVWVDRSREYAGPAALLWAYRFLADSRDDADDERIALVGNERGIWRCHTIFNCADACPKDINQTWSIQQLKKDAVGRVIGLKRK